MVWKTDIPGRGWSSPVVWGDHVFVVTAIDARSRWRPPRADGYVSRSFGGPSSGEDVNRRPPNTAGSLTTSTCSTGKVRWERVLPHGHGHSAGPQQELVASETPVTDGERVYVYLSYAGLYALDFSGTIAWSRPMDALPVRMGWGGAASPALHDGRLYIVNDNDAQSFMAAYDARTGNELWRVARDEQSNWSTPFVWQTAQRTEIVTTGSKKVRRTTRRQPALGALGPDVHSRAHAD